MGKLVYAVTDTTVHVKTGQQNSDFGNFEIVEALNLSAGDTYPLDKLATYQKESIEAGESTSVEVVSESEAKKKAESDAKVREQVAKASGGHNFQVNQSLGDDGSFSDHLVSDAERVANHAARAEAEAGEAGSDDKVTVAGAENEDSPANYGETTRDDAGEQVQGSGGAEAADSKSKKSK